MTDNRELLKAVHLELLQWRAQGRTVFGLSELIWAVPGDDRAHRGRVQWCLARLAVNGLLYTRRGPERGVAPYEHGETDKRFRFRTSQEQAIETLRRMKIAVRPVVPTFGVESVYHTKSLDVCHA